MGYRKLNIAAILGIVLFGREIVNPPTEPLNLDEYQHILEKTEYRHVGTPGDIVIILTTSSPTITL